MKAEAKIQYWYELQVPLFVDIRGDKKSENRMTRTKRVIVRSA